MKYSLLLILQFIFCCYLLGQEIEEVSLLDYAKGQEYQIGGIAVIGLKFTDENALISISKLKIGDKITIPGPAIQQAMKALWKLRLFTDLEIHLEKTIGDVAFLEIRISELPRLGKHTFRGVKRGQHDDLNDVVNRFLLKGSIVTENTKQNAANAINHYYQKKGFLDVETRVEEMLDSSQINKVILVFTISKGRRVKIKDIQFVGNTQLKSRTLRKAMKHTRRKRRLFAASKFQPDLYEKDKGGLVHLYQTQGYRDARIAKDSVWRDDKGELQLSLTIEEGRPYYLGTVSWKGNVIYGTEQLDAFLGLTRGEIYNVAQLEERLFFSQNASDISSLYLDRGYLFFKLDPVEVAIREDTVDLELRIFEGPQATIDRVEIVGNHQTFDHVIRRELRTLPGAKFSRTDIIRSQREIVNLGFFNPESLNINTPVDPQQGTVSIEYEVEERPGDQLELSAGWGGTGNGVIGTLGISFNNFSIRNLFKPEAWRPLPKGEGQRLSVRFQSNGRIYQSANASFTEPWFWGKKPNNFTVAGFLNRFTNGLSRDNTGFGEFSIQSLSVSLGTRLRWPDDFFVSSTGINLQTITLRNWSTGLFTAADGSALGDGVFNNFSITQTISRNSIDNPNFPTRGSRLSLSLQFTPPYSLFTRASDQDLSVEEQYRWVEYHKWRFNAEFFSPLFDKVVLRISAKMGYLGYYNRELGYAPFERFQLGGDGINNQAIGYQGTDIIALRGYEVTDLEANVNDGQTVAAPIFQKVTTEIRYPLSTNPNSTMYTMLFLEAGKAWESFDRYNPFQLKRSLGFGFRVMLPMFGLIGFDYGLGLDKTGVSALSELGKFSIILGFEPE